MMEASGSGYRADVDGLRAVAVLAVVIYHAGLGLTGGYVGVDVFFVISGFLITRLIARDVAAGSFSYWDFWARRARRLVPAMAVVVLAVVFAGWLLLLPHDYRELGQATVAQSVGLANFYFWREAGYFAGPSEVKPLLHMWSLAVEEQFYLVMPILMMLIYRLTGPRYMTVLSGLGLVSLAWCIHQTAASPDSAFYLLPSRAWELLLGGVVAGAAERWRLAGRTAELLSFAGLGAVVFSMLTFDRSTVFPGAAAAVPCLGTAAVILANSHGFTRTGALLSLRPVVFVGLISYSLYLVHWPIFAFASYVKAGDASLSDNLLLVLVSVGLAVVSWRFVEQPFRAADAWRSRRRVLWTAAGVLGCLFAAGMLLHLENGFRSRFSPAVLQMADGRADRNPQRRMHHDLPVAKLRGGLPRLGCDQEAEPVLAIIGDSHGDALMPVLHDLACEFGIPSVCVTGSATLPVLYQNENANDEHAVFRRAVADQLARLPRLSDVMLVGRWTGYRRDEFTAERWENTVRGMQQLGVRLWVVRQVPEPVSDVPRALALGTHWNRPTDYAATTKPAWRHSREAVDQIFSDLSVGDVRFIEPAAFFFSDSSVARIELDSRPLYFDDNHLSAFGAHQLKPVFSPAFSEIAGRMVQTSPDAVSPTGSVESRRNEIPESGGGNQNIDQESRTCRRFCPHSPLEEGAQA